MAFIYASDDLKAKSHTEIENKFIIKYLPVLDDKAVKVYLLALYVSQNSIANYTVEDFAKKLEINEDEVKNCFYYLEEFELVSIQSKSPFEVKILDADNITGTPKKIKPEKYASFASAVQSVITGRMISTNEFMEYYYLLDEYAFEQNALLMIISYCVNLKGDDIKLPYIKKVAKNFAEDGITTAKKVEEKLSSYTSSTPSLVKIYSAIGITRRPDPTDNSLYEKWTKELGFSDEAIICAAKYFKAKSSQKIDEALEELYKNRKFDSKEIENYCKEKNSLYACAMDIAKSLGVYAQNISPYVDNYIVKWRDYGFEIDTLSLIADYCFLQGRRSFESMDDFVLSLTDDGIITFNAVKEKLEKNAADDKFIKKILKNCDLNRKIIDYDRQCLRRWRNWQFDDNAILAAAQMSQGKNNPIAYMNAVLSSWKTEGITTPPAPNAGELRNSNESSKSIIERHYYDLRAEAKNRAEQAMAKAMEDKVYKEIKKQLNSLSIKLAFAEVYNEENVETITKRIAQLEKDADDRLRYLGFSKTDFEPKYKCSICNDTGYDKDGKQCECLKRFIRANNL